MIILKLAALELGILAIVGLATSDAVTAAAITTVGVVISAGASLVAAVLSYRGNREVKRGTGQIERVREDVLHLKRAGGVARRDDDNGSPIA